jgi:hypothetical protein
VGEIELDIDSLEIIIAENDGDFSESCSPATSMRQSVRTASPISSLSIMVVSTAVSPPIPIIRLARVS